MSSDHAEQLRTADLRVTRPRIAVMEAVHAHPHADTDTIFSAVRHGLPEVSRQAVYDVLNALASVGLVRRIQPRVCWRATNRASATTTTTSYAGPAGSSPTSIVRSEIAPCLTPSDDNNVLDGFVLDEAEVIYWGLCPDCSRLIPDHNRDHSPIHSHPEGMLCHPIIR